MPPRRALYCGKALSLASLQGGKDKRTDWINRVNDVRRRVMHPSSGASVSFDELEELQTYQGWLIAKLSPGEKEA